MCHSCICVLSLPSDIHFIWIGSWGLQPVGWNDQILITALHNIRLHLIFSYVANGLVHFEGNARLLMLLWCSINFQKVAPYCASKWAIEGLTKSVAKELPEGMAVVALNPGVVNTDMLASCFGSSASLYQAPDAWYVITELIHIC